MTDAQRPQRPQGPGFRPEPDPEARPDAAEATDATDSPAEAAGDVERRIVLEATPDQVWQALTDPDELAAWWGDGTELDAAPGGEGRFVEPGEPVRLARVVEARPGRRLVLDWWPEDPEADDPAARVTIELVPCPFGTVLTIVERALLDLSDLPVLAAPHEPMLRAPWSPDRGPGPGARALARV
jgi:uncharacterized protein YndB with AHSA1/START domain